MRHAIAIVAFAVLGCGEVDTSALDLTINAHRDSSECIDGDACVTSGGRDGVCSDGICVLTCDSSADCPRFDCRVGHCLDGVCAFVGVPDGKVCDADGISGACSAGTCNPNQ